MKFGLLYEGEVVDVFVPPVGRTINDTMPDERASEYISIPDDVGIGHTQRFDGTWVAPVVTEPRAVKPQTEEATP